MKTIGFTFAAVLTVLLAAAPARAASITSEDFVATIGPTVDFLEASDRLAMANSDSGRVRAFARRDAGEEDSLRAALIDWRSAQDRAAVAAANAPTIDRLGPIFGALSVPLGAIAQTSGAPGSPFARLPSAARLTTAANAELARLASLRGADFDASYRASQGDALFRLQSTCKDFVLNGDDEALRAVAVGALPKVERLTADLRGL